MGDICLKWSPEFIIHKCPNTFELHCRQRVTSNLLWGSVKDTDHLQWRIQLYIRNSCRGYKIWLGKRIAVLLHSIWCDFVPSHPHLSCATYVLFSVIYLHYNIKTNRKDWDFFSWSMQPVAATTAGMRTFAPYELSIHFFTAVNGPSRILACLSASRLSILASRARTSERGRSLTSPLACHWLTSHNVPQMDCLLAG